MTTALFTKDDDMNHFRQYVYAALVLLVSGPARGGEPVSATVESTLTTLDRRIRQFALDGDEATFFASEKGQSAEDHFTIVLDNPSS